MKKKRSKRRKKRRKKEIKEEREEGGGVRWTSGQQWNIDYFFALCVLISAFDSSQSQRGGWDE